MKQLRRGDTIPRPHGQQRTHIKTTLFAILEIQFKLKVWRGFNIHNIEQHILTCLKPELAHLKPSSFPF